MRDFGNPAVSIADAAAKLLLPGEIISDLTVTDTLERARVEITITRLQPKNVEGEPFEEDLSAEEMALEDAATRLLAYLERRAG